MISDRQARLFACIRDVPDFPKPGILFRDITPLLADTEAFAEVVGWMAERVASHQATSLAAIEARGFVFGAALARRLNLPLQLVRKPGKLPWQTAHADYQLEYGSDRLEIHRDAGGAGQRTAIIDDLLATGGTAAAAVELLSSLGGEVCCVAAAIELQGLGARERLADVPVESLLIYE